MTELYGRNVQLQVGERLYTGLRITAKVTSKSGELRSADIECYNLSRETVAELKALKRDLYVRVFAGYETPVQLFQGNPVKAGVVLERRGADRVLRISAKDGLHKYRTGRVNLSLQSPASFKEVIELVAAQAGWDMGAVEVPRGGEFSGVLTGQTSDVLDSLAASLRCKWSFIDDKLHFLPLSRSRRKTGPLFSIANGNLLIGPEPHEKGIRIQALLEPTIQMGDIFQTEDIDGVLGTWKAIEVRHEVDTGYSSAFHTTVVGTRFPRPSKSVAPKPDDGWLPLPDSDRLFTPAT